MNEIADVIIQNSTEDVKTNAVDIVPCGMRVLFTKYEKNPYRKLDVTEEGVILGVDDPGVSFSSQSGEMESNTDIIVCAKVIAAGKDCKYVKAGDDIFISTISCTPVPFRNKGYYMSDEVHVLCIMKNKEENGE